MLRTAKPKLSLSIATGPSASAARPSLSLNTIPRTPVSPSPMSPTALNTRMNKRGYSTIQQPTYAYANSSSSKSILKKGSTSSSSSRSSSTSSSPAGSKRCQFAGEPTVYCVTPIENADEYYGSYVKMSRDEKRWGRQR